MNEANELPPGTASLLEELESMYLISVYVLFFLVLSLFSWHILLLRSFFHLFSMSRTTTHTFSVKYVN